MAFLRKPRDYSKKPPITPIIPGVLSVIDTPSINLTYNAPLSTLQADLVPIIASGTYGSATMIPVFTINTFGQIIAITEVPASGGGGSAAWGSIGAGTGVVSQTDLISYLNANYYLASNPAGYITSAALANYVQNSRAINTTKSITGGGDLSADRTLELVNDDATPGALKYYGTDSGSTKGYHSFPSGRYAVIFQSLTGTAVTGTTASVISISGLVPAGTNTTGDILRVTIRTSKVGVGAGYTIRLYVNTTNSLSGALLLGFTTSVGSPATIRQIPLYRDLAIKDETTNTQVYPTTIAAVQDVGASAVSYTTVAVDHTVDQYYFVALQNASTADSSIVDFIRIERT